MQLSKKNILEIMIVIFVVIGFSYSFYNVLSTKAQRNENRFQVQKQADEMLAYRNSSKALECNSTVYLEGEQRTQDPSLTIQYIYDFEHEKGYTAQGKSQEIIETRDEHVFAYTKAITQAYSKEDKEIVNISQNEWYHYECENFYEELKWSAKTDRLSYGYLEDIDDIINISRQETDENNLTRYIVTIDNTIRDDMTEDMGDTGLRKMINNEGMNADIIKKRYPEIYSILRAVYDRDSEEMSVWLDAEGRMTKIEKDYTFTYYMYMLKQNSEVIANKVGRYGYPDVVCVQDYRYSPHCGMIEMPQKFEEL